MWEGCEFNLTMEFSSDYPATAPVVKFVSRPGEVFWHLNVWTSGRICLNLLNEPDGTWHGQWLSLIHISEPTRLRRISYAVFCLKKKKAIN